MYNLGTSEELLDVGNYNRAYVGNPKTKANFYNVASVFCTIQIFPPVLTTEQKRRERQFSLGEYIGFLSRKC